MSENSAATENIQPETPKNPSLFEELTDTEASLISGSSFRFGMRRPGTRRRRRRRR